MDTNIEERIKICSIELFSKKGFHGTSIREIAKGAECSLPMLYYYYKDKQTLFEKVLFEEFVQLIDKMNKEVPLDIGIAGIYIYAIKQRKKLNNYEKMVYKLATKVHLGFEEHIEVREKLLQWEKSRVERNKQILVKYIDEEDKGKIDIITNIVLRVFSDMTEKIILLDEDIPDDKIEEEVNYLFNKLEIKNK